MLQILVVASNPLGTPDPTAEFKRQVYTVDRKSTENREVVEFELAGAIDMAGVRAPKRQCTSALFPSIGTFTMSWKDDALVHAKDQDPKEAVGLLLNIKVKKILSLSKFSITNHQQFYFKSRRLCKSR